MPTYEYKCRYCKHVFEAFQAITAEPLKKCPRCKRNELQRLIGAGAGVIFKGSGFYVTDYGRGSHARAASGGKGSSKPKPAGDSSPKSDDASD